MQLFEYKTFTFDNFYNKNNCKKLNVVFGWVFRLQPAPTFDKSNVMYIYAEIVECVLYI